MTYLVITALVLALLTAGIAAWRIIEDRLAARAYEQAKQHMDDEDGTPPDLPPGPRDDVSPP